MTQENKGIEYSLIESRQGWDEQDVGDFYFYNVELREDVFGADFIAKYEGQCLDLGLWMKSSVVEVYLSDRDTAEPILKRKIKIVLEEE